MTEEVVRSPCINICELGNDRICKGCHRSLEEIAAWSYASIEQRSQIVSKAKQRQIMASND